jgi:hypothetical protein
VHVRYAGCRFGETALTTNPASYTEQGLSFVLPRRRDLIVRVRDGGAPALPRPFRVTVDGVAIAPYAIWPEDATFRIAYDVRSVDEPATLVLEAAGRPAVVRRLTEQRNAYDETTLDLDAGEASLAVVIRGVRPDMGPPFLQRWDAAKEDWTFDRVLDRSVEVSAGEERREAGHLVPGRYRAWETTFDVATEPVEVGARGEARAVLDLSACGHVTGHVEGPEGGPADGADVWIWRGTTADGTRKSNWPAPKGTFRIPIAPDRTLTLRAQHALWSAHPEHGQVTVTGPTDDVVLRLVAGPRATFALVPPTAPADDRWWEHQASSLWVLLRRDGESTVRRFLATRVGERWEFGGFAPGRYAAFVATTAHEPLLLEGVELGEGVTDLGEHALARGETLRVRMLLPDGLPVPRMSAFLTAEDPWVFHRSAAWEPGAREAEIRGLRPGRYRLTFFAPDMPPAKGIAQTVVVEAGREGVASLDFRPEALDPEQR